MSPARGAGSSILRVGFETCCADIAVLQAVHNFLKSDPRLPPLETDTVAAASGPQAAEAAAAGAAIEAAADAVKPISEQLRMQNQRYTAQELEKKKKEESEALNIIRMRLAADMQGLRRKRGIAAQNNQQKVRQGMILVLPKHGIELLGLRETLIAWCFARLLEHVSAASQRAVR